MRRPPRAAARREIWSTSPRAPSRSACLGAERRRLGEDLDAERTRLRDLEQRLDKEDPFEPVAATTPIMRRLIATLREVARSDATALLTGRAVPARGCWPGRSTAGRSGGTAPSSRPTASCTRRASLSSELFGHERGAFTGAAKLKRGRFEWPRGGTLFLDEIGEIAPATQLLLLRVLPRPLVRARGRRETIDADVRLIAATNRDLDEAIRLGAFREDLFYRLNVIPIHVPALRERRDDVRCWRRVPLPRRRAPGTPDTRARARTPWTR